MLIDFVLYYVVVVVYQQISFFYFVVLCMVFGEDLFCFGVFCYWLSVCVVEFGLLWILAGFSIDVVQGLEVLVDVDIIVVLVWCDLVELVLFVLLDVLCVVYVCGVCLVGLCLGVVVFVQVGLFDGCCVLIYWVFMDDVVVLYLQVQLQCDVFYVQDGILLILVGIVVVIDCCLYLLCQDYGVEIVSCVVRCMVVVLYCQGGQVQYIEQLLLVMFGDDCLVGVLEWVLFYFVELIGIDVLVVCVSMSWCIFIWYFCSLIGIIFNQWLFDQCLVCVQCLLEISDIVLECIVGQVGFGLMVFLCSYFSVVYGVLFGVYWCIFLGVSF